MQQISGCACSQPHQFPRRHFLRSLLPGIVAFPLLLKIPATANHQAKALVLSCIDFRFLETERYFLSLQHLSNQYDWTALAGASLALSGFPHTAEAEAFWDQLELSHNLHHITKVIVLDHQDCGAYARKIDLELSNDREREQQVHADYLNRAYWEIRKRYPDINIELYFVTLNAEVQSVMPTAESSLS
ncbi:carbonic anhydrase [Gloeocapsopsis crepidinum LEGE 06123]|uniref:Carbonic anhydrase n=1 Tax=Gloeocapsopsis crepidinum LEGE 06123 TaxID=588587 RepID=A0ABR9USM2_9CHRO|nr:carbonic anhydrase [Gloeocapsopsis crepidinum]MBE9191271.1 carbonic anhydrase [Gloeocapsopsis crepidinum LEGE 06123]